MALRPLHDLIAEHVLSADRLHGDDTPVPVLARGKCATGRAWVNGGAKMYRRGGVKVYHGRGSSLSP